MHDSYLQELIQPQYDTYNIDIQTSTNGKNSLESETIITFIHTILYNNALHALSYISINSTGCIGDC